MNTPAKVAYLTALIGQSQQREQRYETALASADTRHDTVSATARLLYEQARRQQLTAERTRLSASFGPNAGPANVVNIQAAA